MCTMTTLTMFQRIWKLRKELPVMRKDQPVNFGKTNYKYFDINQMIVVLMPLLEKHNLGIAQPLTNVTGKPAINTVIFSTEEDKNEYAESIFTLPDLTDPQDVGSVITYYRRYALVSFFFMESEDKDGLTKQKEASYSNQGFQKQVQKEKMLGPDDVPFN